MVETILAQGIHAGYPIVKSAPLEQDVRKPDPITSEALVKQQSVQTTTEEVFHDAQPTLLRPSSYSPMSGTKHTSIVTRSSGSVLAADIFSKKSTYEQKAYRGEPKPYLDSVSGFEHLLAGFGGIETTEAKVHMNNNATDMSWASFLLRVANRGYHVRGTCDDSCACSCHSLHSYGPWLLSGPERFIGAIKVSFTGFWLREVKHSDPYCSTLHPPKNLTIHYRLPTWLLSGGISIFYSQTGSRGPEMTLRTVRCFTLEGKDTEAYTKSIFPLVYRGDLERVKIGLANRQFSIYDEQDTRNALFSAIQNLDIPMVKILIQAGADLYQKDDWGVDPVSVAFRLTLTGNEKAAQLGKLISFTEHLDDEEYSDLHKVVTGVLPIELDQALCNPRMLSEVNSMTNAGFTPIYMASLTQDPSLARLLAAAGADPNLCAKSGLTPLMMACRYGNLEMTRALLECGADVHLPGAVDGSSPMIYACSHPLANKALLELLARYGADANAGCRRNIRPLMYTALYGVVGCLRYLIEEADADLDATNFAGDTALSYAIMGGQHLAADILLDHGASYQTVAGNGQNVLHKLAGFGKLDTIKVFAKHRMVGLDPELKDSDEKTPRRLLQEREDVTEELRDAFGSLLASINLARDEYDSDASGDTEGDFHDAEEGQDIGRQLLASERTD